MITINDFDMFQAPLVNLGEFFNFHEKNLQEVSKLFESYYASSEEVKNDLVLVKFSNIYDFWKYPFVANKEVVEFVTQVMVSNAKINSDIVKNYIDFFNFVMNKYE